MQGPEADSSPVITGFGVVSSIGVGADRFWQALLDGVSAAGPVRAFATDGLRTTVACELPPDIEADDMPDLGRLPRASRLAVRAVRETLDRAALPPDAVDALCVGTTMGDLPAIEDALDAADPPPARELLTGSFAERIAAAAGIAAPADTLATSCSAGNLAIGRALDLIRMGRAERVLAGGADGLSRLAFIGFSRMRAMAPDRCTPFARERKGILLGEGAGFVLLESRAAARRRGARVFAEVAGFGMSCDAHHVSTPAPGGRGAAAAMRAALADAAIDATAVDFVSAHGTGTPHNDAAEAAACVSVFGSHRPFVSSVKALIGHTLGAAAAIQAVACTLALRDQRIVPAWHVEDPDPACEIRLPSAADRTAGPVRVVISNGFAFGGNNSCLVLRASA